MSKVCDITGERLKKGNNVSRANNKTKKWFHLNLQAKKFYIPEKDQWIKLKVSTSILRTIHKNGIHAVLRKAKKQGTLAKKFWNLTSDN